MRAFVAETVTLSPRKVLNITSTGDPSKVSDGVFKSLYGTAYSTKYKTFKPRGIKLELGKLCALWPDAHEKPRDEWTGIWAIPVPDFVTVEDLIQKDPANPVKLDIWPGGVYAQILHKGPYSEEGPTVQKLHDYIETELGTPMSEVPGIHEEEYLTMPGVKNQKTIIRYLVKSK